MSEAPSLASLLALLLLHRCSDEHWSPHDCEEKETGRDNKESVHTCLS